MDLAEFIGLYPWAWDQIKDIFNAVYQGCNLTDAWLVVNERLGEKNLQITIPRYSAEDRKYHWDLMIKGITDQKLVMPMEYC